VSWDFKDSFNNSISASSSCDSVGFGACFVGGIAISGNPPFSHVISSLTSGTVYYFRVAARNSISSQVVDPTGEILDNTRWSSTVTAIPANQLPGAPLAVTPSVSGLTYMQVLITPPTSNGGLSIDTYLIEWDSNIAFTDLTSYGSTNQSVANLDPALTGNYAGLLVYEISGLTTGSSYYVRVSAHNELGYGPVRVSSYFVVPAGKSGTPASISFSLASTQVTPVTTSDVTWAATTTNGGTPVSGYLVEWFEPLTSVPEVQLVQFIASNFPTVSNGKFSLSFGPFPGVKKTTSILSYLSTSANVRSELINLGYADGLLANYSFSNVIGELNVARSSVSGAGYQWKVTNPDLNPNPNFERAS
jgi:hypothetical protein